MGLSGSNRDQLKYRCRRRLLGFNPCSGRPQHRQHRDNLERRELVRHELA